MIKELLKNIAAELQRERIEYMIIGGQAVLLYGEPRLTRDIDITLGVDIDHLDKILDIVKRLNFSLLTQNVEEFIRDTRVLPVKDPETGFRIDFIFSWTPYEKEAIKRANKIKIDDFYLNYISIEDLIIHKLISHRPRDIEDLKTVLLKQKILDLDEDYIKNWLKIFSETLEVDLVKRWKDLKNSLQLK